MTSSGSLRAGWTRLSASMRRRIVLTGLLGVALAARDVLLLAFTAGLFAVSELGTVTSRPTSA